MTEPFDHPSSVETTRNVPGGASSPGPAPPEVLCPHCHCRLTVDPAASAEVQCRECGSSFRVAVPSNRSTADAVQTLGRFLLLERIGQGSFGLVWRARDTALDRVVALKVPHPGFLDNPNLLDRFHREARAAAQLRHPGIVCVHEVLDIDGQPVIVSDFISGPSLKDLLELRRLTFRQAAALVADVAEALDYAHDHGLVHRDIKPANILIECARTGGRGTSSTAAPAEAPTGDSAGKPLLVDFGLALREEAEVVLTVDGQLIGTPAYMSPEQAAGRGHRADRRSDVYSLGVVLYLLLCGETPFRGARAMLIHQVLHEPPRAPRRLNDKIPRDLETICLKALAKEPGWRYPTARELAEDLRRHLRGEPIRARPIGAARALGLWCRRKPALATATALAAGALACLLALAVAFALRERYNAARLAKALDESNTNLQEARYRLAESYLSRGLALCEQNQVGHGILLLARSLETAPPEAEDLRRYLRWSLGAWQSRCCSLQGSWQHPEADRDPVFSPDGSSYLTVRKDGTCQFWEAATGARKGPPFRIPEDCQAAALGTALVVTGHKDGTVRRWNARSGEPLGPPLRPVGFPGRLALTPDGSSILIGTADVKGESVRRVTLWTLQTGEPQMTFLPGDRIECMAISPEGKWILTGEYNSQARLWDAASGNLIHTLPHSAAVKCAAFSADGKTVATGCLDGSVRLWDTAGGGALDFRVKQERPVEAVALSRDGRLLLTGSRDNGARLWSVATQEPIGYPLLHARAVTKVAFSPEGSRFLTIGEDRSVRLWGVAPPESIRLEDPGQHLVRSMAFSADGKTLLTGGSELDGSGAGRVWDALTGKLLGTPLVHKGMVLAAAFSPDNRTVATAGMDGTARLADAVTGRAGHVLRYTKPVPLPVLGGRVVGLMGSPLGQGPFLAASAFIYGRINPVHVVAFSPKGDLVLTGSEDGIAQLWETQTGKPFGKPLTHPAGVMAAAFSPEGDVFFTGSSDGGLRLWRTKDQALLFPCAMTTKILRAAFSHDGKMIVVGGGNEARLYDTIKGTFLDPPLLHEHAIWSVAFSHDDRLILTASEDGSARLWDVRSRTQRGPTLFHGPPVKAAVFSPDSRLVLTGSLDLTARLWDVSTGRSVGPACRHRSGLDCVAFSPDGRRFATGSSDHTARLWNTPVPLEGEPQHIVLRIEVLTGLELDGSDALKVLDAETWQQRRRLLGQADRRLLP